MNAGLLATVNGVLPTLPQSYVPYPIKQMAPGFVWKTQMFPARDIPISHEKRKVKSGFIPTERSITRLL